MGNKVLDLLKRIVCGGRKYDGAIQVHLNGRFNVEDVEIEKVQAQMIAPEDSINFLFKYQNEVAQRQYFRELEARLSLRTLDEIDSLTKRLMNVIILRQRSLSEHVLKKPEYQHLLVMNSLQWHLHDIMHNVPAMLDRKYFYDTDERLKGILISHFIVPFCVLGQVAAELPKEYVLWGNTLFNWYDIEGHLEKLEKGIEK